MITPEKFTIKAQEALQRSQRLADEHGHQQIEPEHLLLSLLMDREGLVISVFKKLDVPTGEIENRLQKELDRFPKVSGGIGQIYLSKDLNDVLGKSLKESESLKDEYISVEHLLLALSEAKTTAGEILRENGVVRENILRVLQEIRGGQRVTDQNPEESGILLP